jgi:hypothetical protein
MIKKRSKSSSIKKKRCQTRELRQPQLSHQHTNLVINSTRFNNLFLENNFLFN